MSKINNLVHYIYKLAVTSFRKEVRRIMLLTMIHIGNINFIVIILFT